MNNVVHEILTLSLSPCFLHMPNGLRFADCICFLQISPSSQSGLVLIGVVNAHCSPSFALGARKRYYTICIKHVVCQKIIVETTFQS